jgi:tRNA(fMet)-specific endonuclease VapC
MLQFALDTDHLTLLEYGHPSVTLHCTSTLPGALGVPIVTAEELLRGRLAAIANAKNGAARMHQYSLLLRSLKLIQQYPVVEFDQAAEDQFQILRTKKLRIGTRDQKIAAIALANRVILITRNKNDFGQVPGLVLQDWSV